MGFISLTFETSALQSGVLWKSVFYPKTLRDIDVIAY